MSGERRENEARVRALMARVAQLTRRAGGEAPLHEIAGIEAYSETIDADSRLALGRAAAMMGWNPNDRVAVTLDQQMLRVSDAVIAPPRWWLGGAEVAVDGARRITLPYGLRTRTPFQAGVQVVLLVLARERIVLGVSAAGLVDHLVGRP